MEPTYRIELTHHPEMPLRPFRAAIYRVADDEYLCDVYGATREDAVDEASKYAYSQTHAELSSTVFLTEEGDIHDPHDTPTLRSVS